MTPQKTTYGVPGLYQLRIHRGLRIQTPGFDLEDATQVEQLPAGSLMLVMAEIDKEQNKWGWVCVSPSGKVGVVGYFGQGKVTWNRAFECVFETAETT